MLHKNNVENTGKFKKKYWKYILDHSTHKKKKKRINTSKFNYFFSNGIKHSECSPEERQDIEL